MKLLGRAKIKDRKIKVAHATIIREGMKVDITTPLLDFIAKSMPKLRAGDVVKLAVVEMMQSEYDALPDAPPTITLDAKKIPAIKEWVKEDDKKN